MRARFVALATVFSLVCVALAVASAGAAVPKAAAAAGCTAKRAGGSVTFGQFSIGTSVDPAFRSVGGAGGTAILTGLYDTLLRLNPGTGKVEPYLAKSFTINPARTQVVLKLRPGIKFGDGNAFDAAAVVAAQQRYIAPGNALAGFATFISSIVAVDPMTVQYNLSQPWTPLLSQLGATFGMIADPAVQAKLGTAFGSTPNTGAGVGPYELSAFSPPTNVVLKAKQNYWQGPVCIDTITSTTESTSQQGLDSFKTGQYQIAYLRDSPLYQQYITTKPRVGQIQSEFNVQGVTIYINSQSKTAHLDDVRVRQALQMGMDANSVNQRGYSGTLTATTALVPKGLAAVKPTKAPKFDVEGAKKLIDQVKTETGWDGSMRLLCANTNVDGCTALSAVITNIGLKLTVDSTLPVTPYTLKVQVNHDYDIALGGIQVFNGDFYDGFYRITIAPNNYGLFSDPQWTDAWNAVNQELLGTQGYSDAIAKVAEVQAKLVPTVNIGSFYEAVLYQNNVKGLVFTAKNIILWGKAYLAASK
jgi:peptide/nickel transport system substrate-binding protein